VKTDHVERGAVRDIEFQHHEGDDAAAEGFQAAFNISLSLDC
jgi:hypothetical protein